VTGDVGVNSIVQFQLERRGDEMKHCQKIKWRQQARLGFMGKKCDTAWRRWPEERRHRGRESEETMQVKLTCVTSHP
jgi:hypothetical protein